MSEFNLKEKDLTGQLEGYPIEVVELMLKEQVNQKNHLNLEIFKVDIEATQEDGGFDWGESEDGLEFWIQVIRYRNFNRFFKKYPRKLEIFYTKKKKHELIKILLNQVDLNRPVQLITKNIIDIVETISAKIDEN